MAAPFVVGAASGLANGIMNSAFNLINMENQSAVNKDLLMWQWKNFSSPAAQARSMAEAGISPAHAFGSGGSGYVAQPSVPSASIPSNQIGPVDFMQNLLSDSAIIKNAAEAKKAGSEAAGQDIENELARNTFNERVQEVALRNHWTKEQTSKTIQEVGLLCATFNETQQKIENLRSQKALTDKQANWYDRHMSAEIEHVKASKEYLDAMRGLTESQKELFDATLDDMKQITSLSRQQLEKVVDLLGKYGDAKEIIGLISQVLSSASDLIGTFKVPLKVKSVDKVTWNPSGDRVDSHTSYGY